ncbi:hypothetical protein JOB18_028697 [Solea senegalensis]|uniref:Uncharacterized protein n=1 Tax=Solea senegalensis TaxID=28829 RepID=A0AAV6RUE1_SOLSE|nr:hypothetical protein JOB18_028697 [Solea senegalensis]
MRVGSEEEKKVLKLSVECVDDADVCSGIVVYDDDDATFHISSHPETANNDGQGRRRSVTVFQFPCYANDGDITMSRGPPATDGDPNPSLQEVEEDE